MFMLWWGVEEMSIEALACTCISLCLCLHHSSNVMLRTCTAKIKKSRQNQKLQKQDWKNLHWTKFCEWWGRLGRWGWLGHFFLLQCDWWRVACVWCPTSTWQWNLLRHVTLRHSRHLRLVRQTIRPGNTYTHTHTLMSNILTVLHFWSVS